MIKIPVRVTCGCGAQIDTWRAGHKDALAAEKQFIDAHESCKEKSVFDQVFGDDRDEVTRK